MKNRHLRRAIDPLTRFSACLIAAIGFLPGTFAAKPKPASAESLYALGQKYLKGDGVPRDEAKSLEFLRKAAGKGHAESLATLGYCYSVGAGVQKDDVEARRYFSEAAEKGSLSGQSNLGLFLIRGRGGERNVARGLELMEKSASAGSQQTAVTLGEIYYFGEHTDGTPDFASAHRVLSGPAKAGHANAQNMLGVMLKDGRVGAKDEDAARVWFEKAAWQGNGKACFNLAELWNYQSSDHHARIEALRWLMVGKMLKEVMAQQFLKDIQANVPTDELESAASLASITQEILRSHSKGSP